MILTPAQFEEEQRRGMPPVVEGVSLEGQTVIITGANTGLGYEAAKHIANRGAARLIIVCRSETRGREALEKLKAETNYQNAELWLMDLSSFESVKAIKEKIDQLDRLDILIENAALATYKFDMTPDGWERSFQVNVISTALHMLLHIPKLLETAKRFPEHTPRIALVSSDTHYWQTIPVEVIDAPNTLKALNEEKFVRDSLATSARYAQTKMLATFLPRMFQSRLPTSSPTVTCCSINPGFCHSELGREITSGEADKDMAENYMRQMEEFAFTSEEGSRQLIYGAIGQRDREEEMRAAYVSFSRVSECSDFMLSKDGQRLQEKMWNELVEEIGKIDPRTTEIVKEYLS